MTGDVTSRQIVPKSPACPEGLFLMDGIEGLRSLPKHSVDMLLTDPPYGTTRNFWDVPLPLPELWEAVKWAVKPDGAVLFFAQCPYDKVLGASNLSMLRYEWVWYKSRCTGFLNARRAPLKRTENILVFYQKLPYYDPQFEQGKPYKKISRTGDNSPNYGKFLRSSSGSEDGLRFPETCWPFLPYSVPSTPRRNPWNCASISSEPIPGPGRWWQTSALAPARLLWLLSIRAAALYALKPPRPFTPQLQNAYGWLLRRSKPGRKEYDYRKLFYHLRRSPLAVPAQ